MRQLFPQGATILVGKKYIYKKHIEIDIFTEAPGNNRCYISKSVVLKSGQKI
jgi:hypothetical protein